MKILLFLIFLAILIAPASAGNISIEIFENSAGINFIAINDGDLIECDGTCIVEIDNITSEARTITDDDIKKIGKQVSIEMYGQEDIFNTTEFDLRMNDIISAKFKDQQEWYRKTYMGTEDQIKNLTKERDDFENALEVLDAKFAGYDSEMSAKNSELDTLKKNLELYWSLIIILGVTCFILLMAKSDFVRSLREWRER